MLKMFNHKMLDTCFHKYPKKCQHMNVFSPLNTINPDH